MYNKSNWQYQGLYRWFPLDGSNGNFIRDEISGMTPSGQYIYNDGTYYNTFDYDDSLPRFLPNGKQGRALYTYHDGTIPDNIRIAPNTSLIGSHQGYTVSLWFYPLHIGGAVNLYEEKTNTSTRKISLRISRVAGGAIRFTTPETQWDSTNVIESGWNHVIFSASPNRRVACVNGAVQLDSFPSATLTDSTLSYIGINNFNTVSTNRLLTHDIRVYSMAFPLSSMLKYYHSESERGALYKKGRILYSALTHDLFNNISLHSVNADPADSGISLYIAGNEPLSSGLPLYGYGSDVLSNNHTLYTFNGEPSNSGLSLVINGHDIAFSGLTLFIPTSTTFSSGISLYSVGHSSLNSGINLYTNGSYVDDDSLKLYTKGLGFSTNKSIDLFTWASTSGTNGIYDDTTLYLHNTQTIDPRNALSFFIKSPNGLEIDNLNLVTYNTENILNNNVNLFISGPTGTPFSGISLYIGTQPGVTGAIPYSDALPLFINRYRDSDASAMSLYMKVAEPIVEYTTLTISGANILTNYTDLFIEGSSVPTYINNNNPFYIRGGV